MDDQAERIVQALEKYLLDLMPLHLQGYVAGLSRAEKRKALVAAIGEALDGKMDQERLDARP